MTHYLITNSARVAQDDRRRERSTGIGFRDARDDETDAFPRPETWATERP